MKTSLFSGGGVLAFIGIALSVGALLYWKNQAYSQLVPEIVMRIIIPGASLLEIGLQSVFSGFVIGILKIRTCEEWGCENE